MRLNMSNSFANIEILESALNDIFKYRKISVIDKILKSNTSKLQSKSSDDSIVAIEGLFAIFKTRIMFFECDNIIMLEKLVDRDLRDA